MSRFDQWLLRLTALAVLLLLVYGAGTVLADWLVWRTAVTARLNALPPTVATTPPTVTVTPKK